MGRFNSKFTSCLILFAAPVLWAAPAGIISTIAGTTPVGGPPIRGFNGDGGPANEARLGLADVQNECDPNRFEQTVHLSVDTAGNVYFADSSNQRIRRITAQGVISTVAGSGERPATNRLCEPTGDVADGVQARAARLYNPADVISLSNGNLLIADQQNNRIRQVTPAGAISTIAGSGFHNFYAPAIPATVSPMDWPSAVAVDANGIVHFAEMHSNRVGRIASDGRFATVAGTGIPGFSGDNNQANTAQLRKPAGIAFDAQGNLYIADEGNHRIRKVTPGGTITTIAGTGQPDFSGDGGPATQAALNTPMDVKVDASGTVYIADTLNHRVRTIDPNGVITTIAGTGQPGRGADGILATSSSLNSPAGLAIGPNGDLYIVDWQNYLIRKVTFSSKPAIGRGGVVNGASFAPGIAPGAIISIFGQNLASSRAFASETPLPDHLADVSVQVNGVPIPLYFASPQQINGQLPFEVAPGNVNVTVVNSFGSSDAVAANAFTAAPGIFQFPESNQAVALNQNQSINSPANPETRGNAIVLFLTGQGAVNAPVATGKPAPSDPPSHATGTATAIIGGAPADVSFIGLAPGFVGLGQANLVIPAASATGDNVAVVITIDGQASNSANVSVR